MIDYGCILAAQGFYPNGSCQCGGITNKKFRKKDLVVYIRESRQQFYIKYRARKIVPISNLEQLENALGSIQEKV